MGHRPLNITYVCFKDRLSARAPRFPGRKPVCPKCNIMMVMEINVPKKSNLKDWKKLEEGNAQRRLQYEDNYYLSFAKKEVVTRILSLKKANWRN